LEMAQANDIEVMTIKKEVVTDTFIDTMEQYRKQPGKASAGKHFKVYNRSLHICLHITKIYMNTITH